METIGTQPAVTAAAEGFKLVDAGGVCSAAGFQAAAVACGLRKTEDLDLALVYSPGDCVAAGVFTRNQVVAAPVIASRETLAGNSTQLRAVLINAGTANAATGAEGLRRARATQALVARALRCHRSAVLVLSTGVIGAPLPMDKIEAGIGAAAASLSRDQGARAARAIMTTDTRPKEIAVSVSLPGGVVTIGGMAKGAGMIHPDMATMLALITTDAAVPPERLAPMLKTAVSGSFNSISVDGDTSTNDAVLVLANGAAGVSVEGAEAEAVFMEALNLVCFQLARAIVRDGEGATKLVEIEVAGAGDDEAAGRVARTIATSALVKTALAGSDPNWGRIVAAAGRAGVGFDQSRLSLSVGHERADELILASGGAAANYEEAEAAAIFAQSEFKIRLDLGRGPGFARVLTCDLTQAYVAINADYRT